ncbi:hypothetical protein BB561_001501 [Smittium simulii]|uniref:2-dehydropantoate 2-reductase n=1 Tax=Smittium simulii TaxID=133385 RepID=A0A2T9YUA0_9FUNG|nr:hypothetical protein BB561_001501 [Smittium simulii]
MTASRKYLVIGGGAVGSIFGWRMQEGGADVSVVCRSNYAAVKANGYNITSIKFGNHTFTPNQVYRSAQEAVSNGCIYDFILVCTKSLPNIEEPTIVVSPSITDKKTTIVLLQNGIGIETYFAKAFPENPILSCSVYIDVIQLAQGTIDHGSTSKLEYGLYETSASDKVRDQQALKEFESDILAGDIDSKIADNIQRTRWTKIVWNASFNPISVVSGGNNSRELLRNPLTNQLLRLTMTEVLVLGEAITGERVASCSNDEYITNTFDFTDNRPNPVTPSMLVDYINKRPMEHQVILKNPIDLAKKHNISVPILETIYTFLITLEEKNLAPVS